MSRPLRVLYVTHASNLTGASRSLLDMLSSLPASEVTPTVLLREHGPLEEKLREMDVRFVHVPYLTATTSNKATKPAWLKKVVQACLQPSVDRFIRGGDFDLIHNNSLIVDAGMVAAKRAKIPYVCHVRDLMVPEHGIELLDEHRTKRLLESANHLIFISKFISDKFHKLAPNVPYSICFDVVNSSNYYQGHKPICEEGVLRIILAGRFEVGKGQLEAIQATRILLKEGINVILNLVGSIGSQKYYNKCMDFIKSNELIDYIKICEFADDLRLYRAESDISLTCSTQEAMGRVTVEGMLAGCLVIGANTGATTEIITKKVNGLLYESGSPESLARQIEWAINNPDVANTIAARAQSWALDTFDCTKYGENMIVLYNDIMRWGGGS